MRDTDYYPKHRYIKQSCIWKYSNIQQRWSKYQKFNFKEKTIFPTLNALEPNYVIVEQAGSFEVPIAVLS